MMIRMLKLLKRTLNAVGATLDTAVRRSVPLLQQQRWFAFPPFRTMRRHPLSRRSSLSLLKASYGERYSRSRGRKRVILAKCNRLVRDIRRNFYTLGLGRRNPHVIPGLNQVLPFPSLSPHWMRRMPEFQPKEVSPEFVQRRKLENESARLMKMTNKATYIGDKKDSMEGWSPRGSGFTSCSIEGRSPGPPVLPSGQELEGFSSVILFTQSVGHMSTGGRVHGTHVIVAVGNGKGVAGWALAGSTNMGNAVNHARDRAALRLRHIPLCDEHTIFHDMIGQQVRTVVKLERRPRGFGLRCGRTIREICKLVGIKDMESSVMMNRNPLRAIPCVFNLLEAQETHQDLADKTGLHVLEYRRENAYFPQIVASPSDGKVREGTEHVLDMYDDIKHRLVGFWPYSM